ncbi:MAG: DUF4011 domain-containing protein [Bacteroidetes bacterium]|nr:DUF4011 domain-containing protein [Bacteroidota bacterium]
MTSSKLFLEKLLLKLKTGSSRSIHLNALPGRFARLDLFDLINIDQSLHYKFIQQLLDKDKFNFNISIDFKLIQKKSEEEIKTAHQIVKTLNAIFYQQQDEFLEHGTKTFAFGYPLLIKRDPTNTDKILKAPLLIWYLDLVKDSHKSNHWTISRNENHPVIFNEVLRSHIETYEHIQMDDILELLEENIISESQLLAIAKLMLEKLGTTASSFDEELLILPGTNKASIEKITKDDPWIRWSGIFGLYKTQKQSIIQDIELLIDKDESLVSSEDVIDNEIKSVAPLSIVPLDPSQESILNTLHQNEKIVIQGPPGTGKSQSLTALISNALYHGKTCLVVCEKKTALDIIYKNLANHHLAELCMIIEDVHSDRKAVVDKVRHLLDTRSDTTVDFRHYEFEENLSDYLKDRTLINEHMEALNVKCFGDDKLIALIAKRQKLILNHGLKSLQKISSQDLLLNYEEFRVLVDIVAKANALFRPLAGKDIPFEAIQDSHFNDKTSIDLLPEQIDQMLTLASTILSILTNGLESGGELFNALKGWKPIQLKLQSPFFKKAKQLQMEQKSAVDQYQQLMELFEREKYIQFEFPEVETIEQLSTLQSPLKQFVEILQPIHDHIHHLDIYLPWRRYLIQQSAYKSLLTDLSKHADIADWLPLFKVFYYGRFIDQYISGHPIDNKVRQTLENVRSSDQKVTNQLSKKILALWEEKQKSILKKRTITNIKNLYNYRRNKAYGRRNSLRKIIHHDTELFSHIFPVTMVNPSVCSSIFPLQKDLYDLVFFDEASQLRIEDTFTALLRGRFKIVSGDKHQMPPTSYFQSNVVLSATEEEEEENDRISDDFLAESDSLLEYCMDSDFESTYLDFHYRSQHPDLIAFSNNAFYGGRLVPMPPQENYQAIAYYSINGLYEQRMNIEEATALVDHVFNEIHPLNGIYPSVGIATFNISQRNLIWDLLMERTYQDEKSAKILDALIEQGLFVKNLENIQGDERDILLISTTFGPNKKGQFKQLFGPISQSKGYQLMNVMITRAKQKIAVFSSIPDLFKSSYIEEINQKGNTGKGLLYAYLSYAEALSQQQTIKINSVLELVDSQCAEKKYHHEYKNLPLFHQLLLASLLAQYDAETVQHNYTYGGFVLEIALLKEGKPVLALITENQHPSHSTAYRMLLFKTTMLEKFGIDTYFISALDWYHDWETEEQQLLKKVRGLLTK